MGEKEFFISSRHTDLIGKRSKRACAVERFLRLISTGPTLLTRDLLLHNTVISRVFDCYALRDWEPPSLIVARESINFEQQWVCSTV